MLVTEAIPGVEGLPHNSVSKRAEKGFRRIRDQLDRPVTQLTIAEPCRFVFDKVEAGPMPK
jgi:hypothetical protein